jgi:gliding motility-associated-like protein
MRLIFILFILFSFNANAAHIVGGDMFYDCLGGNEYRITLKLYRDCLSDGAEFDNPLPISIFDGNGTFLDNFDIAFPGSNQLEVSFNENECVSTPSDICIEEAIYTKIVTLPASTNGYTLAYQRCCRGGGISNLNDSENEGLTLTVSIPTEANAICNSSPRFNNSPPTLLCANETLIFDHSATDPDGDEIIYELYTPNAGGSSVAPAPDPVPSPPYDPVVWAAGISATNTFGSGSISINATTGQLNATPELLGLYVVGIRANEYRNGILIGSTTRDFLYRVVNCEVSLTAATPIQTEQSNFTSFCQGLTFEFDNTSFGGNSYQWDFGVEGISTDVSTAFEPTYTFPEQGIYTVTLVVSQSEGCSDTTEQIFEINNELTAEFTVPDPQCITGNSFDFIGEGSLPDGSVFNWSFGGGANPAISTDQNPNGIIFDQAGNIPVTYTASFASCIESVTQNVFIYKEPTIDFTIADELKCAPYTAYFQNLSDADTEIFSDWTFGNGTSNSSEFNAVHIYENPGFYDVSLTISTTSGCINTLTLERPNLIEIFPAPVSVFNVTPLVQDEYEAEFTFTDLSDTNEVVKQWFYFGNGAFTPFSPYTYFYPEPGVYYPYQIVENSYGCRGRTQQKITVVPVIPILVPNAFTPDGDAFNNTFKPVLYKPQQYSMQIFNRWGQLIYQSNDAYGEWDGKYQDNKCPDDIYLWRIVYNDFKTGLPQEVRGHVSLLR